MQSILARASSLWRLVFCSLLVTVSLGVANTAAASTGYDAKYWNLPDGCGSGPAFPDTAPDVTSTAQVIDFNWADGSPAPAIHTDCFAAEWTKTETFAENDYVFSVNIDDGARVYVDDVLILDAWSDHGGSGYTVLKHLSAGSHTIKVRYYENGGGAAIRFNYHQPYTRHSTWGTNGPVFAVDTAPDGTVYTGGGFSYAGPYTGSAMLLNATTGAVTSTFPQFDGSVYATTPDGSGGWYVGGSFVVVGEPTIQNLAHVDAR